MAIRIRCGIGCGVVCIGSGHGLPHLFCALQQRVAHFPAETRRPGKTGLGIVRFWFFQPGRANDHILVFAGVIAHNDLMARGLMRGIRAAGRSVPEDKCIIGFDNIPACTVANPALTSVAAPLRELGATAARLLLDLLAGSAASDTRIVLPSKLVVRDSTTAHR